MQFSHLFGIAASTDVLLPHPADFFVPRHSFLNWLLLFCVVTPSLCFLRINNEHLEQKSFSEEPLIPFKLFKLFTWGQMVKREADLQSEGSKFWKHTAGVWASEPASRLTVTAIKRRIKASGDEQEEGSNNGPYETKGGKKRAPGMVNWGWMTLKERNRDEVTER